MTCSEATPIFGDVSAIRTHGGANGHGDAAACFHLLALILLAGEQAQLELAFNEVCHVRGWGPRCDVFREGKYSASAEQFRAKPRHVPAPHGDGAPTQIGLVKIGRRSRIESIWTAPMGGILGAQSAALLDGLQ